MDRCHRVVDAAPQWDLRIGPTAVSLHEASNGEVSASPRLKARLLTGTPTAPLWRTSLRIILFAPLKKNHLARRFMDEAFPVRSLLGASSIESCYVADLAGTKPGQPAAQRYFMKSAPAGPCRFRCAQRFSLAKLFPYPVDTPTT